MEINKSKISKVENVEYLGVVLDDNLKITYNINIETNFQSLCGIDLAQSFLPN